MEKYDIGQKLPAVIELPLRFRNRGQKFEGSVAHPIEVLTMFEPIDVLNGATELVDGKGRIIVIRLDDEDAEQSNEYPEEYRGIYYTVD